MQREVGNILDPDEVARLGQAQGNIIDAAKAQEEEKGRGGAPGLGPGLPRAVPGLR